MPHQPDNKLQRLWYASRWAHLLLAPLSGVFASVSALRRWLYRTGRLQSRRAAVPVVIVGNITVGGTGKTPVTIWLADQLRSRGFRPGVVSRGYGGVVGELPVQANAGSDPDIVGDEPLLIAARSRCPVLVHPNRVAAADALVKTGVDVIIADDGLQHYRLQRDFEIVVIDGERGFGNGWQLPAGPLREPRSRLDSVDQILVHEASSDPYAFDSAGLPEDKISRFHLVNHELFAVGGEETRSFDDIRGNTVHAVAGIGNPERFFRMLESHGLEVVRHPYPDHAALTARDLQYDDGLDIVMTEKDAVKCREFATSRCWYVPVDVDMHDDAWLDRLEQCLRQAAESRQA